MPPGRGAPTSKRRSDPQQDSVSGLFPSPSPDPERPDGLNPRHWRRPPGLDDGHSRGHGFDPHQLHQLQQQLSGTVNRRDCRFILFLVYFRGNATKRSETAWNRRIAEGGSMRSARGRWGVPSRPSVAAWRLAKGPRGGRRRTRADGRAVRSCWGRPPWMAATLASRRKLFSKPGR